MRSLGWTLRWLTIAALMVGACRVASGETVSTMPAPTGYVSDLAGVLTPETRAGLEELCTEVDRQAHAQIAVVTVKSLESDPVKGQKAGDALPAPSIEEFATALEDKWKVGTKGTDRGILLIVSLNPRKYRIEVGYGLEGILPDGKVGDIGRDMVPSLHTGDYNAAIALGAREIAQVIATDAGATLPALASDGAPVRQYRYVNQQPDVQVNPVVALILLAVVILVIGVLIRTGHIGILFFLLFSLFGGGGRGGGGGFGGGDDNEGGGGGFGGFGGGGSGGGGASGDF